MTDKERGSDKVHTLFGGDIQKQFDVASGPMLEAVDVMAKLRRRAYMAAVAEGFTEEQALELCKTPFGK